MQISNYYNSYGSAYTKSVAASRSARSAQNDTSFADYLNQGTISDKVTISKEAQAKTAAWDYDSLSSVVSDLKAHNKADNEGRYKESDTDKWLPENRARLEEIYAELEKLQAEEGTLDPTKQSDAYHKRSWELISQRKVLEVYGESKVVTDKMMAVGSAAYREAEREWGEANGFQVEKWAQEGTTDSLLKMLANYKRGDPEELEKQLEEWKNSQLVDARSTQTKKDFTQYMDKMLGRGKPSGGKSPEEKIKELTAKIKTLQTRLSEVVSNPSLPPAAKSGQAESLNSQINSLHAQISELAKSIAENPESAGTKA